MTAFPSTLGTSSFGAAKFWYVNQGDRTLAPRGKVAVYDRAKVPYGSLAVTQLAGTDTPSSQITVLVKAADVAGLRALVGTVATLALLGDSSASAALVSCVGEKKYSDGYSTVQLTFEY